MKDSILWRWRMGRRVWRASGALMAVLGLMLGVAFSQQTQTAPVKETLEVTYYFLPG
jgi:anti-sigma-K factor RskA